MRADAVRNRERLIKVAIEAFAEHGADASLDDIAKRAGVGPGTLYRHFPTRLALQEAAYREAIDAICARAHELIEAGGPDPLTAWLRHLMTYLGTKRGLGATLAATLGKSDQLFVSTHKALNAAGDTVLDAAKKSGAVRDDVTTSDVLKLVSGIGLATEHLPDRDEQVERLFGYVLDGLRPQR